MNEVAIIRYITGKFAGLDVPVSSGDSFFIYDPARNLPPERRMPFATLVTGDHYETVSNLDREGVFRLNIGVGKQTFRSLFGSPPTDEGGTDTSHDFTALDRIMPHPVYGRMYWLCVLNPSEATFETVKGLLAEAYELAVERYGRHASTSRGV